VTNVEAIVISLKIFWTKIDLKMRTFNIELKVSLKLTMDRGGEVVICLNTQK
jgi:hypothetical protein